MSTIIVYYSLDGNTAKAAEALANMIGAELCEIQPVKPIKSAGRQTFSTIMTGGGQVTFGICPKLKAFSADPGRYDRIILGTPVWAGKCAAPVYGFIKKYCKTHALADKIQAAFTLSGSGDNSGCVRQLQKLLPNIGPTVSLADKSNSLSADNEKKLREFAEQLKP